MNNKLLKTLGILLAISMVSVLASCKFLDKFKAPAPTPAITGTPTPIPIIENKELTLKMKKEEGVIDARAYVQGEYAYGVLLIKSESTDENGKKLAKKYSDSLSKIYTDKNINVQAVRNNKNIANILIDKKK